MSEIKTNSAEVIDDDYDGDLVECCTKENKEMEQIVPDSFLQDDNDDDIGDMDLVNGPNPWLPAYGYQLHQQVHFQQAHEDIRANEANLVQQVDFLETILEETSDDLQSDSDRSGTTYWLGSDSETESVIHIKSNQRAADRPDGSGSECNSVVPKKRRRRNGAGDSDTYMSHEWASPRSSRSSSSRSSSLIQFETLERTCATVSPSGYSYDSLEYSNRSNSVFDNTSPDSLEDDDNENDKTLTNENLFDRNNCAVIQKIRPYRSFESLDKCHKLDDTFGQEIGHGFMFSKTTSNDLSERGRLPSVRSHDNWYERYDDNDEYEEDSEDLDDDYRNSSYGSCNESRGLTGFTDTVNSGYSTSLDFRNTIDLREIGLEPKHETILDLARSQIGSSTGLLHQKLNITSNMASGIVSGQHYQNQQRGWSNTQMCDVNFRITNKSQSVPGLTSLASGINEEYSQSFANSKLNNYDKSYNSTCNLFDNYTRVVSLPVDLNLFGTYCCNNYDDNCDDLSKINNHKMADNDSVNDITEVEVKKRELPKRTSSVRTQKRLDDLQALTNDVEQSVIENNQLHENDVIMKNTEELEETIVNEIINKVSTVKTQDHGNHVLEMAIAMENDIDSVVDEAIKQLKRQVEEATSSGEQITFKDKPRQRKVKNNASYELAQQWEIDDQTFQGKMESFNEDANESLPSSPNSSQRRRVHNNASYELAQQSDYIKTLQSTRPFQRMDACDEMPEFSRNVPSKNPGNFTVTEEKNELCDTVDSSLINSNCQIPKKEFINNNQQLQQDGIIDQIKKNSDLYLIYGEGASVGGVSIEDEVDISCLETKPIDGELNFNNYARRENDKLISDNNFQKSGMSFLSNYYPEKSHELLSKIENNHVKYDKNAVDDDDDHDDGHHDDANKTKMAPTSADTAMPGERLWRVVVEQQNMVFGRKEREINEEVDIMEKENEPVVVKQRKETDDASQQSLSTVVSLTDSSSLSTCEITESTSLNINYNNKIIDKCSSEMSAIAAKRLAMGPIQSSSPRNSQLINNNDGHVTTQISERKKSGLGGFLQRFSKLRFSGRSKVPRSEIKRVDNDLIRGKIQQNDDTQQSACNKRKKEPDYIIIPLHPPEDERKRQEDRDACGDEAFLRKRTDLERSASCVGGSVRPPVCSSKPPLPPLPPPGSRACATSPRATPGVVNTRRRATTDLGSPAAIEMAKARAMQHQQQQHYHNNHHQFNQVVQHIDGHQEERPVGLLETNLDDEPINVDNKLLNDEVEDDKLTGVRGTTGSGKKTRSLLNLNHTFRQGRDNITENSVLRVPQSAGNSCRNTNDHSEHSSGTINQRPHKSMEFLLDKENLHFIKPPENELQKVGERVPSEHELRVQRSLQRLNVPDWYKNSPAARDGFRLKRHSDASQHGGWRSLGSKTTSLSSLSSSSNRQPATGTAGPLLSPSPTPPVFSRWSTSLLNSAGSSPANSARSSFNHRQPYLGWRSQERLANPRTPAERLAQGILPQLQNNKKQQQQQQMNQQIEVRNSIKEVTSAIVHYVQSGQEVGASGVGVGSGGRLSPRPRPDEDRAGARSTSPRGSVKLCWMESSFVGSRRVDSPETPMSLATDTECCTGCNAVGTDSCSCIDSATSGLYLDLTPTRDDPRNRKIEMEQESLSTSCLCASPSSSAVCHHHHHHQQQQQQLNQHRHNQQRHHRGELLLA